MNTRLYRQTDYGKISACTLLTTTANYAEVLTYSIEATYLV